MLSAQWELGSMPGPGVGARRTGLFSCSTFLLFYSIRGISLHIAVLLGAALIEFVR